MAIRVVVAFGMESVEFKNYTTYLTNAKKSAVRNHIINAMCLAGFLFAIYCMYSYAFYIGSIYVGKQYMNHGRDRPYSGGDSIGVFFAVIIGLFSISMITG